MLQVISEKDTLEAMKDSRDGTVSPLLVLVFQYLDF